MTKAARQESILRMIAEDRQCSVETMAGHFDVSPMTIRRDLQELSETGKLRRTHGGALASHAGIIEFSFQKREEEHAPQKHAIAREVVKMIQPGMAISLDTGTTTLEVARAISSVEGLKVLTTSLAVASILYTNERIELVLVGGNVRRNSPDLTGPVAEDNVKRFRSHLAILGADAVTPDGAFSTEVAVSRLSRALMANAGKNILAVDSSKFQRTSFVQLAELGEIDVLVTDDLCPKEVRRWLNKSVAQVVYAGLEGDPNV